MARIRNIKPEFFSHEELQDMEIEHPELHPMLVFSALWTQCEWSGVFSWSIRKLKLSILPFLDYDLEKAMGYLLEHGFIKRFSRDGKDYGFVLNFSRYQAISGNEKSQELKYPVPDKEEFGKDYTGTIPEQSQYSPTIVPELDRDYTGSPDIDIDIDSDIDIDKGQRQNNIYINSLPEKLNPGFSDSSQRIQTLSSVWNELKIGPPFKKTVVNLSPAESQDLLRALQTYPKDDAPIGAMQNYKKIRDSPAHDLGGCVYKGFVGFMVRGVEKFCDEAAPFEIFKVKNASRGKPTPGRNSLEGL